MSNSDGAENFAQAHSFPKLHFSNFILNEEGAQNSNYIYFIRFLAATVCWWRNELLLKIGWLLFAFWTDNKKLVAHWIWAQNAGVEGKDADPYNTTTALK